MKTMQQFVGKLQLPLALVLFLSLFSWTAAYAQITPLGDSYTDTADPTTNNGAKTLLDVDGATQIGYVQFNLASIPAGASVSQATLKLYVNTVTTAGSFNVDYVNGIWAESTIDASNAPALGSTIASGVSITSADKNQYILINVTEAVRAWLDGSETNNGIALVANGTFTATFDSKENTTTSHPAELDIAFAGGDGTITGVTTASGSGLTGGGASGTLNLSLTNACSSSQILQWNGSAWTCASAGTGTITGIAAGTDLTGGGSSGNVTLNLNTAALNSAYAQLGAANTFTGQQTINNTTIISGANGSGVLQVTNTLTSGSAPGISATTKSTNASALRGNAVATTGTSNGVFGNTASPGGAGVLGSNGNSSFGYGVQGTSANVGVHGTSDGQSALGSQAGSIAGVWGDTGAPSQSGYAGVLGTADENYAGYFTNNSTGLDTVFMENNEESSSGAVVLETAGGTFDGTCFINVSGDISCSGTISGIVSADGGARKVTLYSTQSTENWFEDAGSSQLASGSVHIALDSTFAQTVNTGVEYHVFLTPKGDCEGLYVTNETPQGFDVHELRGGHSAIAFDYRIMAKRAGYENVRLADLTEHYQKLKQQQQLRHERMQQHRAARAVSALAVPPATSAIAPITPEGSAAGAISLHR